MTGWGWEGWGWGGESDRYVCAKGSDTAVGGTSEGLPRAVGMKGGGNATIDEADQMGGGEGDVGASK